MDGRSWMVAWEDVTEDEFWRDGYDTGHADGAAGWPNMLDVLGRPMAEVIPLRRPIAAQEIPDQAPY